MRVKHLLAIYRLELGYPSYTYYWIFFKSLPKIETCRLDEEGNIKEFEPYSYSHPDLQKVPNERVVYYSIDAHRYME